MGPPHQLLSDPSLALASESQVAFKEREGNKSANGHSAQEARGTMEHTDNKGEGWELELPAVPRLGTLDWLGWLEAWAWGAVGRAQALEFKVKSASDCLAFTV